MVDCQIQSFIEHNYPELRKARQVSIGIVGKAYRISVVDCVHVNHTLKIRPEEVDEYLAAKSRVDRLEASGLKPAENLDRGKEHDRERS